MLLLSCVSLCFLTSAPAPGLLWSEAVPKPFQRPHLGSVCYPATPLLDGTVLQGFYGSTPAERFGGAVAGGLDLSGDGVADVIVGARHADPNGTSSGAVSVFSGNDGSLLVTLAGQTAGDWFGAAVSVLGDLNGDGRGEIVVGAPYGAQGFGEVSVHSGLDGSVLLQVAGTESGSRFGDAVAGLDDVDGDGQGEIIVGAPVQTAGGLLAGRVTLISGADGDVLWTVDGIFGDLLGTSVSGAGDMDGDGLSDVLVGAPLADAGSFNSGRAMVYSGRDGTLLLSMDGLEVGAQLGDRVALAGDVDLDGRSDFVLGAPGADATGIDSGAAEVRSGLDGHLLLSIPGSAPSRYLQAVAAAGDCDLDGVPDIAVGEAAAGAGGSQQGEVRIVSGATGETLLSVQGESKDDWLGAALASTGDVDGDGRSDLIIGAPGHDDNQVIMGSALLFSCASPKGTKGTKRFQGRVKR